MAARIKDIAKRADVSEATVSLVLNQKPGVSVPTRERVLKIARDMDYGANQRQLFTSRTGTIRFLKIAMHGHTVNRDHTVFIADYIDGLTRGANSVGFALEINSFRGSSAEEIANTVQQDGLKGVVILGTELTEGDIELFGRLSIPKVFLDTYYDFLPYDFVDMNNKDSIYTIIRHLLESNHREIGFVRSSVNTHNFYLRDTGFWDAVDALKLSIRERDIFTVDSTFQGAYDDMVKQLSGRQKLPTALVCTNDIISYGVIKALKERGYRVPQDVSVVGFDDLPFSAVMEPPLTTIQVSKKKMGETAMQLLSNRIDREGEGPAVKIQVGGNLVVRESVQRLD